MPPARRRPVALPALSLVLALFFGALGAAPARGDAPLQLPAGEQVVDSADALTVDQENQVKQAVTKLSADENVQLYVVYVRNFDGKSPAAWAQQTQDLSEMSYRDILLAVSVDDHKFYFGSADAIDDFPASDLRSIADSAIAPAVRDGRWEKAALDTAHDLDRTSSHRWIYLLIAVLVVLAILAGIVAALYRRSKRRQADDDAEAAIASDAVLTVDELTSQPIEVLDPWSAEVLTSTDNAVSVSADELALAVEESGDDAVAPFRAALTTAESALAASFRLRRSYDVDAGLGTAERHRLLVEIISMCSDADAALDEQVPAFDRLRDLVTDAGDRLDALADRSARLADRLDDAAEHEAAVTGSSGRAVAQSVAGNVALARELVQFADDSIGQGREAGTEAGGPSTVAAIRSAECALDTAGKLLDALADAELNLALVGEATEGSPVATATVSAAESFIDTRRGAVGTQARIRLSEAERLLDAAERTDGPEEAAASTAAALAHALEALSLSGRDVEAWRVSSDDGGPVLTGVLVDAVVSTGPQSAPTEIGRGGFTIGGRTPGSFGGTETSGRIATGGRH
ncbi:TPM domain-containing protein [Gordonia sp. (in: high G+C Gram-positive bacteria)]|uniref:TPM domain-containing protein n=1 Tax=Gordonia sp. (in: high G+C Gram-positive bacteria) TaxID=84139 RepID=UPI0026212614|nr:TPM domain-containing protein [Gordonia sp. (in: high G+C Gram-positive bacteria)]